MHTLTHTCTHSDTHMYIHINWNVISSFLSKLDMDHMVYIVMTMMKFIV